MPRCITADLGVAGLRPRQLRQAISAAMKRIQRRYCKCTTCSGIHACQSPPDESAGFPASTRGGWVNSQYTTPTRVD